MRPHRRSFPIPVKPSDRTGSPATPDRGLPVIDPLADFCSERLSQIDAAAAARASSKPAIVRPARRLLEVRRASSTPAAPSRGSRDSASQDHRVIWSFVSGSVVGAALCLLAVSLLTASELPQRNPAPAAPQPVSAAPPETPPAEPPVAVANPHPAAAMVQEESPAPLSTPIREVGQRAASSSSGEAGRSAFVGALRIQSTPPGARVFIDRTPVGVTPVIVANLTAGSHAVRVEADGHMPWSSAIRVIADRQTNVNTTLSASAEAASLRR